MSKARASTNSTPRGSGKRPSALERLGAEEARTLLLRLLAAHPDLRTGAEQLARSLVAEVDFESVAREVEDCLRAVDLDDLNDRAGTHHGEYTEPTEAAWVLLQEASDPFLADMRRQTALALDGAALDICKGIVLGLYRVRRCRCRGDDVLGWAPDFTQEAAVEALRTFVDGTVTRGGRRTAAAARIDQAFIDEHVPDWRPLVERAHVRVGGPAARPAARRRRPDPSRSTPRRDSPAHEPPPRK